MIEISFPQPDASIPLNDIKEILRAALDAADPYDLVQVNLRLSEKYLLIGDETFAIFPDSRIVVVGLGKASISMVKAAKNVLGHKIHRGVCICKHNPDGLQQDKFEVYESTHPVHDKRSVESAKKIRNCVGGLTKKDIVLFLLSGGGSALACLPTSGISLRDIQNVTDVLLKKGATINELNTVRKHLDEFKGGGFLRMVSPARIGVLVLSDVIGSPLDVIASGPAIEDGSSFLDAWNVLKKYFCDWSMVPQSVVNHIERGCQFEKSPQHVASNEGSVAYHKIIGSNDMSVNAACKRAKDLGYSTEIHTYELKDEARRAAFQLFKVQLPKPSVVFAGGETTVTVTGTGLGGRNLEMALGSVETISKLENTVLVSFATDGEDGPTDAAGAIVSSYVMPEMELLNKCIYNNDAYNYFDTIGGLIKTGPTGTNVNDIAFLIRY
jgi:hydroxypyruvate reductase